MARDRTFWRNVAIIGAVHVAVLSAVVGWSSAPRKAPASNVLWLDGGTATQPTDIVPVNQTILLPAPVAEPPTIDSPERATSDNEEAGDMAESDLRLSTATPRPKPSATAISTSRPTPKTSPKPTPKKIIVAKASATPRPVKPSPTAAAKKDLAQPKSEEPAPTPTTDVASAIADAAKTGTAPTAGISGTGAGGTGARGVGPGGASQFGWYAHMLHDRFFSQWAQPTSVVRSGAKMSTLVKLRIEKDGTVSRFTILKPSGNVVVDESVAAVAKRVAQVDPLPSGLGDNYYEVNINFELNSDQ